MSLRSRSTTSATATSATATSATASVSATSTASATATAPVRDALSGRIVVIIDDLSQIGPVEEAIVRLVAAGTNDVHVISTDDAAEVLVAEEAAPRRLRLMFLMARLADRLIPVTGEDANADTTALQRAITRVQPDRVYLTSSSRALQRLTRRDLASQLRRLVDVDVMPLPLAA